MVNDFEDDGMIVAKVKEAVNNPTLYANLAKINTQYSCIPDNIEKCESRSFTIKEAALMLNELDFHDDECNIQYYLQKRIQN